MVGLLLAVSGLVIWFDPGRAPLLLLVALCSAGGPWLEAWKSARGTALRPALVWAGLAIVLAVIAQLASLSEPLAAGRPGAGRLTYVAILALLAALVSVLNARTPGGRVWAGLMVLLVVVFLIPWLEEQTRLRRAQGLAQLHLDAPWTIFYGLLVVVGLTNYLPTRFGIAAACLGLVFFLEYLGLTRVDWPAERRATLWSWVAWTFASSMWVARFSAGREPPSGVSCERLWFWFRDHWGVVWALRVQERFNRSAGLGRWPVRLTWFGLEPADPLQTDALPPCPAEAEAAFRGLIRRFAQPWRLDVASGTHALTSCDQADSQR
ncbi:MAG: hypothetical protein ACHRXM_21350 [Isosphaerales bacterium]